MYLTLPRILRRVGEARWRVVLKVVLAALVLVGLQLLIQSQVDRTWGVNPIWLLYAIMAVRVIRLDHPPAALEQALDPKRKALGWLALIIFLICFSPAPIEVVLAEPASGSMVLR